MQPQDLKVGTLIDDENDEDNLSTSETRILHEFQSRLLRSLTRKQCQTLVHDLPQLYTKPSASSLLETLDLCSTSPPSSTFTFNQNDTLNDPGRIRIESTGLAGYLTNIISSSLSWIEDEDTRERIWESASARLSERSGRTAAPSMTRSFQVTEDLTVRLYEPSLTEDNLGLKTWTSSLLLARRLHSLRHHIPQSCTRVLELGAGTGLVGISAAFIWQVDVLLTDLPEIVPNLELNIKANSELLEKQHSSKISVPVLTSSILDWSSSEPQPNASRFDVIFAADPLYSPTHATILARTIHNYLAQSIHSRFILELPVRDGYATERAELRQLLEQKMRVLEEGTEFGYDDWEDSRGRPKQVECWWSVWCWTEEGGDTR